MINSLGLSRLLKCLENNLNIDMKEHGFSISVPIVPVQWQEIDSISLAQLCKRFGVKRLGFSEEHPCMVKADIFYPRLRKYATLTYPFLDDLHEIAIHGNEIIPSLWNLFANSKARHLRWTPDYISFTDHERLCLRNGFISSKARNLKTEATAAMLSIQNSLASQKTLDNNFSLQEIIFILEWEGQPAKKVIGKGYFPIEQRYSPEEDSYIDKVLGRNKEGWKKCQAVTIVLLDLKNCDLLGKYEIAWEKIIQMVWKTRGTRIWAK